MTDADRRILERAVPGTDRPSLLLQGADHVLGVLPLGEPQAGHCPAVPAVARQEAHAMLSRPRFDAPAHGVMPFPTRVDAAFALDARELHVERSEEHTSELQSPDHLVCR